jgi:hypothetical protein
VDIVLDRPQVDLKPGRISVRIHEALVYTGFHFWASQWHPFFRPGLYKSFFF